ncbi:MAG: YcxB family protein [Cyclobacteriaceae bacterium]
MIVRTKKYKLPTKKYIGVAFKSVLGQQWWVFGIYLAICAGYFWIPNNWWIIGPSIALVLYFLFWLIQFAGVTQLEQGKFMFEKLSYEISSQQILIKLNAKQGMPMKWEQIKRVKVSKDAFVLFASKAQLVYLPYKIFNNKNEISFIETVLKRKGYTK